MSQEPRPQATPRHASRSPFSYLIRFLILPIVLGLAFVPAMGAWTRMAGTENLDVESLLNWDGMIYLGTQDGEIYSFPRGGAGPKAILSQRANCFAAQAQKVYAGTEDGVYMSQDKGATWKRLGNLVDESILSLAVAGDTLFAGTFLGLYVSRDGGVKWERTGASSIQSWVEAVGVSGNIVYAGSGDMFIGQTLNRSEDGGKTWKAVTLAHKRSEKVVGIRFLGDRLFVASNNGMDYSPDKGATWTTTSDQAMVFNTSSFFDASLEYSDGALFFIHSGDDDFVSLDKGSKWSGVINPPFGTRAYAAAGDTLIVGSQEGIYTAPMTGTLPVLPRAASNASLAERSRMVRSGAGSLLAIPAGEIARGIGLDGRTVILPLRNESPSAKR
jgi:photosystem II stability/assembly factor-like uncharacterized protein